MIVTFVSQCEKKSLKRTRRILDAFANRIGNNVWQTAITEDGLQTVKQLLRKSATKSTAVSCHRNKTRQLTELVWIVGNKRKFNEVGVVPVNRTKRNILHSEWENEWSYASSIQIIATLAALLHDIGKSTVGFQKKLLVGSKQGDSYRHEWISLKLFELMIGDCSTDEAWLDHLMNLNEWLENNNIENLLSNANKDVVNIKAMPPLAQWIAWLIVTHHRLPPIKKVFYPYKDIQRLQLPQNTLEIKRDLNQFYGKIEPFDYWVKNPKSLEEMTKAQLKDFWQFEHLVINSPAWQKNIKRWSKKALNDPTLMQLSQQAVDDNKAISDPFLLHISRLCLMVGDHNYSSLKEDDSRCITVDSSFKNLAANTDRTASTPTVKQSLEEHLLGVGAFTAHFCRALPIIASEMPTLRNHDPLAKPTGIECFKWQNQAFKMTYGLQKATREHGFFGVNMASTGAGKTIGNARIMYALADPKKGARFTIALGLRILTLQTGLSFRKNLKLAGDQLAILVGGSANKKLFELAYDNKTNDITDIIDEYKKNDEPDNESENFGSESSEDLLDEIVDSDIDYQDYEALNLDTVIASPKARDLIFAPIVTCTVDHIIQASECKRGGKYIAPMLRLLSSDLILDEPDDFDQADLPALSRLVHLAGLFGTRVLLSSATLTPDLVTGLFEAYMEGRKLFNQSQNKPTPKVVCAWFDEQPKAMLSEQCSDVNGFQNSHKQFCEKRGSYLAQQPIRRKAKILPFSANYTKDKASQFYSTLAQTLVDAAIGLHYQYHEVSDNKLQADKVVRVSIGLIRVANINNITSIAMQLFKADSITVPDDTVIHVACYHAKQLLLLRNALENKLDRILDRSDSKVSIFNHSEIKQIIANNPAKNHIFIVLATPVAEVGRDHDYDWAIVEPSSMRSIIQLAGRVWRHRPDKVADEPNILLLQYNIRYFKHPNGKRPIFTHPGFETTLFKPPSYDLNELMTAEQLAQVDARPRIKAAHDKTVETLSDLEHQVMRHLLNNPKLNYVNAYWDSKATANRTHTHLQQISPFRAGTPQDDWLLIPRMVNDDEETDVPTTGFDAYYAEDVFEKGLVKSTIHNKTIQPLDFNFEHAQIKPWLSTSLNDVLQDLQVAQPDKSLLSLAITYSSVSLDSIKANNSRGWAFHEFFGFVRE
ncbi:type I-F CRISPR-associated helicase Cas3f [Psychrobacter sp. AOP22-C1-22]|uniref:type I-F CRISPR-associated helicase Cas3f n=1 Tax=unclassified Psychrobacter TaxID=196806 RepID=UPI00178870B7|nr:type I-F CRISPR-associated helicase Cas3f [Psychrobacter sp. FME6]MBE0407417.1 type I-F CRISPR-associated helicase Cas3 [Psychrobacter sp. FME6]